MCVLSWPKIEFPNCRRNFLMTKTSCFWKEKGSEWLKDWLAGKSARFWTCHSSCLVKVSGVKNIPSAPEGAEIAASQSGAAQLSRMCQSERLQNLNSFLLQSPFLSCWLSSASHQQHPLSEQKETISLFSNFFQHTVIMLCFQNTICIGTYMDDCAQFDPVNDVLHS